LEDGRITDSQGRTVDFKNTVIIMTSNVGAKNITAVQRSLGFAADESAEMDEEKRFERVKEAVMGDLRRTFRPEFLNRIDETIVFRQLTEENICEIARRMLRLTAKRMEEMGVKLEVEEDAVKELAKNGFDPVYGARPLRRAIQNRVEDAVAEQMLEGRLQSGTTALVTFADGVLKVIPKEENE